VDDSTAAYLKKGRKREIRNRRAENDKIARSSAKRN